MFLFVKVCFGIPAWRLIRWDSPRHYTVDPMLLPLGNPFKCREDVLSLQPMIPPKRFDIFSPCVGCSEGLDAFRFSLNSRTILTFTTTLLMVSRVKVTLFFLSSVLVLIFTVYSIC